VENTALSTWTGSANITTLGTVTTGTWNGSVIAPAYLGTGTSITTKYLRGDGTWQTLSGGGDASTSGTLAQFAATTSAQLAGVISDETGSGALVFATSPTLVTPALGTPASGTLTNCTFPTLNQNTTGSAATVTGLTVTAGKTLTVSNTLTLSGTDSSTLAIGTGGTLGTAAFKSTGTTSGTIPELGTGGNLSVSTFTINNGSNTGTFSGSGLTGNRAYALPNLDGNLAFTSRTDGRALEVIGIACSDQTTVLTTGQKIAFDMPFAMTLTRVYGSLTTAPTVSACTVDIEDEGTSILNAVLSFGTTANNAETSTFAAAASTYALSKGDLLSIDIDSVGSSNAGLVIFLEGYRT
jgi:hypothetical protein